VRKYCLKLRALAGDKLSLNGLLTQDIGLSSVVLLYVIETKKKMILLIFLGAFAKLRKAIISFAMSVRPTAWYNSSSTGWIFMKYGIEVFFQNMSRKLKFL